VTGFEWLGELARASVAWVPRLRHICADEAAVKFVRERTVVLTPGMHWFWPLTSQIRMAKTARCILELDMQPLITADNVTVLAGGIVAYRVTDVHKYLVDNYDADTNLSETCEVALRRTVISKKVEELQTTRVAIDNLLTKEVQSLMGDFGVEVLFARLAGLAPTQVLYLAGPRAAAPLSAPAEATQETT